jgi:DNA-binding SARP family transcriptional activator
VCLLGLCQIVIDGRATVVQQGSKTEALLAKLAMRRDYSATLEELTTALWPDREPALAKQSLHTLVHSLHRQYGQWTHGVALVRYAAGSYRLNTDAGMRVDVAEFDALAAAGERDTRLGEHDSAAGSYRAAVDLYRGDLSAGADIYAVVERERLRALYHTLLARLTDFHLSRAEYGFSLQYGLRLLTSDPCREDAHRLIMRCYVRQGQRAQALRQYHACESILRSEFDAAPEPATRALYDQTRLDPSQV